MSDGTGRLRWAALALALAAFLLALQAPALAAPGDLDLGYGDEGHAVLGAATSDILNGLTVDAQGRAVIVGQGNSSRYVERLTSAGEPDSGFASGGIASFTEPSASFRAVAAEPDGGVVAVGAHTVSPMDFGDLDVFKFAPGGALDESFAGDGTYTVSEAGQQGPEGVAIEPGGAIVFGGWTNGGEDAAVWRLLPGGTPDPSFDGDGKRAYDAGDKEAPAAMALGQDGRILLAGTNFHDDRGLVFAVEHDGAPDTAFGTDGARFTSVSLEATFQDLAVRPSGEVLAVGYEEVGAAVSPFVEAFGTDGVPDPGFGTGGLLSVDLGANAIAEATTLQPDGKLLVAGRLLAKPEAFVLRLLPDGSLDPTFGSGGVVLLPNWGTAQMSGIALESDWNILLAGNANFEGRLYRLQGGPIPVPSGPPAPGSGGGSGSSPVGATGTEVAAPSVTHLKVVPSSFHVAASVHAISRRDKLGTTIGFTASAPGAVTLGVQRIVHARHHKRRAAIRTLATVAVAAGHQTRELSGRLAGRPLAPGRYGLVVTEVAAGLTSLPAAANFKILP